jgi:orotidine-5'-phosphate decarboxylase
VNNMKAKLFHLEKGVIPACDVETLDELNKIISGTSDVEGIVGYKIGLSLTLHYGLKAVVEQIKKISNLPVIYDHQKAGTDIPQVGDLLARVCRRSGVEGVIIFPQSGPETEKAFIEALIGEGLTPLVGGEMTHPKYLEKDGGYIMNKAVERMYKLGAEFGAEYFIVPGNKPERIAQYKRLLTKVVSRPKFCMPGIGRQGGDIRSAFNAAGQHAYAIIGSGIYKAKNIKEAARFYCKEAIRE